LLVVKPSTPLSHDRERKVPLYAEAGILETWLVDLTMDEIEMHSERGLRGYGKLVCIRRGEWLVSTTWSNLAFAAALPPEG